MCDGATGIVDVCMKIGDQLFDGATCQFCLLLVILSMPGMQVNFLSSIQAKGPALHVCACLVTTA